MSKGKKPGGRPGMPPMGGMGNMGNIMAQVNKLQEEMGKAEAALATEEVTASVGGGMVTVVCTGKKVIKSITIKPEAVTPDDVEMLQDMVLAAVNEAMEKAEALHEERMGALTGGLNLPPGLGF
jgi:DNA-binding YbaB/EbfC family protein